MRLICFNIILAVFFQSLKVTAFTIIPGIIGSNAQCKTLSPTWTPQWASVVTYHSFNGTNGAIADAASIGDYFESSATAYNGGTNMSRVDGQVNNAVTFDGTNDYISIPDSDSLSPSTTSNSFSLSLWAKISDNSTTGGDGGNYRKYLVQKGTTSNYEYSLFRTAGGGSDKISFCLHSLEGSTGNCIDIVTNYILNTWYHLTVVGNGTIISAYANGRLASAMLITTSVGNGNSNVQIGTRHSTGNFNGVIDEFAYWNTFLSSAQVLSLYESQFCNK